MQKQLTAFRSVFSSTVKDLSLHPGQETRVPVNIENPGKDTWVSSGQFPVTVSYKWFKGQEMLPIEGERTILPAPLAPGQSVNVDVKVVAPNQPGDYTVRITLVQEAVAWFLIKGDSGLPLSASVK